ncbi:IclR family transcriptional regulator [Streptodolium elevatio]|uniref:Helix-turn-helix domain-containing protein n=1 Tax=Streptodolium elevatio TaxID=3157996 RepID=A0ABV3DXB5_9ACTN
MPERRSPPTERVAQVLNLLAEHASTPLSLAVIADRLELSKPTCLGILTTLTETGFVHRGEDKAYRLGPTLTRLGRAAEGGVAPLDVLLPYLHGLHRDLGLSCLLTALRDGEMVVVGRAGTIAVGRPRDLVGERFPAVPPLGLPELLWNGDQAVDSWLSRPPLIPVTATRAALRRLTGEAREAGFLIERLGEAPAARNDVLANLVTSGMPDTIVSTLRDYLPAADWDEYTTRPPGETVDVATIHAPVHDHQGTQHYTFSVVVGRRRVPTRTCATWTRTITETAEAATKAIGGWNPWTR